MHETAHALPWVRHLNYMVGLSYIISNDGIVQLSCRIPYFPQISHFPAANQAEKKKTILRWNPKLCYEKSLHNRNKTWKSK